MKHKILQLLAFISYYCGIDALFYRLNRRAKRILTFHDVLPDELFRSDLANGVSNSASAFRQIVSEVAKHFSFSTDVADVRTATITFDDGFLNQYETAGTILQEMGNIPAILFAAGDEIDNSDPSQALIVEQLLHWTTHAPNGHYVLSRTAQNEEVMFELTSGNRGTIWCKVIRPAFVADAASRGRALLAALDAQCPMREILSGLTPEYRRLRLNGVSRRQLDELRSRGWKIGWHTQTHFPLSALSTEEQRREITPPLGFADVVFSYPYGECLSVNAESVRLAQEVGYPCAVSNWVGRNPLTGRYFMPRMSLPVNKYLLHFRLSGAELFVRNRTLLPVT